MTDRLYDQKYITGDLKRGIHGRIPMSPATFWERVRNGTYPAGFKYGSRRYWTEEDVGQMIDIMKYGAAESSIVGMDSPPQKTRRGLND